MNPASFPPSPRANWRLILAASVSLILSACGGGGGAPSGSSSSTSQSVGMTAEAALGEEIFKDPSLSLNGNQSCASCHVAERGHAGLFSADPAHATETGSDGVSLGGRVAPSIRYLV